MTRRWENIQPKDSPEAVCATRGGVAARRAFTLIELIVVIIIVAIFAGLTLPRAFGNSDRLADVECQDVQRLLTIAAERESLSPEPVGLEYDHRASTLRLLVRRIGSAFAPRGAGASGASETSWVADPLISPVTLSRTTLTGAWADGRALAKDGWRLVFSQSDPRPSLVLQVDGKNGGSSVGGGNAAGSSWYVALSADAPGAVRAPANSGMYSPTWAGDRSTDLDSLGRGQKAW